MRKWIILIIVIAALGSAAAYRIHDNLTKTQAQSIDTIQRQRGIPVRVYSVERRDLKETISISGTIKPLRQIKIAPTITRRIAQIHVTTGQSVKKDQPLVTLDDRESTLNLSHAQASLAQARENLQRLKNGSRPEEIQMAHAQMKQAQADFELLKIELKRQQRLYKEEATTLQMLQDTQARFNSTQALLNAARARYELTKKGPRQEDIKIAQAQLDLAQAAVELARKNLKDHYLTASFNGVVGLKYLEEGDIAEMNNTIFLLADLRRVYLDLNVSELYIPKISVGMIVDITVDALPDKKFQGKIAEINPLANPTDRAYITRIIIENKDNLLRSGMFARAHIIFREISQALVIPSEALKTEHDKNYVFIVDDKQTAQRRDVIPGDNFENLLQIKEGLNEGDKVITFSQNLQPSDKVIISE